ncbi:HAD family hydrolase [Streptomyces sp. NPDC059740]|uniref:HAD family hydrolase n=1 Tax=Streptomyces sp. NPDC059740 TaxID=3346926 RepID=UPI00365F7223
MRYDLVIFDNDGVLVDSEPLANTILAAYLTELGHPTTYEESVRDYMGAAIHRVHDTIRERTGRRLPATFDEDFHQRVFDAFARELQPVAGVEEVLRELGAAGVPYCVASSGSHEKIRVGHRTTGLDHYFLDARVFSAEDVGRGKPAPDLFLHAARSMGVAPERCAVVEDSVLGVEAAVSAGMDVYGYTAMTEAARLHQATALFSDMARLPGLLAATAAVRPD